MIGSLLDYRRESGQDDKGSPVVIAVGGREYW